MMPDSMNKRALVEERLAGLLRDCPPDDVDDMTFWGAQFDAGLAWVDFPERRGGIGVDPRHQTYVNDRIQAAGGSLRNRLVNVLGIGMGAPTLIAHGTPQQQQLLRPMFTTEEIWCQLFSEPGAGSDLAGLATSAVQDGDTWIINGQKVWTTLAHLARRGMLLTRTDPGVSKHAGMTFFLLDMDLPGIDVRPLYQITGEAEFNEVYLDDVRIPDDRRVGEVGQGWSVAMTTLMNERVAIGGQVAPRSSGAIGEALRVWHELGHDDDALRDRLIQYWIEAEGMRLTSIRAEEARRRGTPGPEGSTTKLQWAELNKAISAFTVDLLGAEGMLFPGGYEFTSPSVSAIGSANPQKTFLRSRANSIEGGTSEIMRNILGERVLGLPGEPRIDKNIPWRDIPRS